jgi:hypothetical protein
MVGLVIARARHTAKIRAKKGYFTQYPVLNGCDKLKTVCPRTECLSVPVIYFHITPWFEREPAVNGTRLLTPLVHVRVSARTYRQST